MGKKFRAYVVSYLRALYFSLAMSAMFFLVVHYFQYSYKSIALIGLAGMVSVLSIAALLKALTGDRFLSSSCESVLSVSTQKKLRVLGILMPLPALAFCIAFITCLIRFDYSPSAYRYVEAFTKVELALFDKSVLSDFIYLPHACPDCQGFQTLNPDPALTVEPTQDIDFGPYMIALQQQIKDNWHHPHRSASTRVIVEFKVCADGEVCDLKLVQSSGMASADRIALQAVKDASPFASLPDGSPPEVDIRFAFGYNVQEPVDSLFDGPSDTFTSSLMDDQ